MEYLTQDVVESTTSESSNTCREKVAALFINHKEYPLRMETNIIGRNPDICQIVLNEMTVSSKHAIIKLSKTGHFIMDLGSRNKTKLNMTVLERDIPHEIKDEDWVHFGDVFAIFRLNHDDDDDLPMTQCVFSQIQNSSNFKRIHSSSFLQKSQNGSYDKEELPIAPSQEQGNGRFKIPSSKLIKSSKRISAIGTTRSDEIDNVNWKSSKKSTSLTDSSDYDKDIHLLETQVPGSDEMPSMSNTEVQAEEPVLKTTGNIQVPDINATIFNAETQLNDDELPSSQLTNKISHNNDSSIVKNNSIIESSCIVLETDEDDDHTDCELDDDENDFNKTNGIGNYSTQDDILTQKIICNENNQEYSEEMVPHKIPSISPKIATKTPKKNPLDKDLELGLIEISDKELEKANNNLIMKEKGDDNINDVATQIVGVSTDDVKTQILETNTPQNNSKEIASSPPIAIFDDNFYSATQDILNDLCSQREMSTDTPHKSHSNSGVSNLTTKQIKNIGCVETLSPSKNPSDSSDVDATPKKVKLTSMHIDLPDSQEIGPSISLIRKTVVADTLSDSENDDNNTEENTPILFKSKKIKKSNLTEKLDTPSRLITRVRKPTSKLINNAEFENIMRPDSLFKQQDQVNVEIINENLSRLRTYKNRNNDLAKSKLSNENEKKVEKKETSKRDIKSEKPLEKCRNSNASDTRKVHRENKERGSRNEGVHSEIKIEKGTNQKEKIDAEKEVRNRGRKRKCDVVDPEKEIRKNSRHKKDTPEKKTTEVRRSSRLKKEETRETKPAPKSILKKYIEQSTVCTSSLDSLKPLKRQANNCESIFSPQRLRSPINATDISRESQKRSTPARSGQTQYVCFTYLSNSAIKNKLKSLGAVIVDEVEDCTVLVAPKIKRTAKFFCALGLGRPIVGIPWVQACANANTILDPRLYPLKDEETEKLLDIDLLKTMNGPRDFLKGYNVSSTPSVILRLPKIKQIVECSGGRWKENGTNWICLSMLSDKNMWSTLKRKGATIVSIELITLGVLKQQIEINKYRLC